MGKAIWVIGGNKMEKLMAVIAKNVSNIDPVVPVFVSLPLPLLRSAVASREKPIRMDR